MLQIEAQMGDSLSAFAEFVPTVWRQKVLNVTVDRSHPADRDFEQFVWRAMGQKLLEVTINASTLAQG